MKTNVFRYFFVLFALLALTAGFFVEKAVKEGGEREKVKGLQAQINRVCEAGEQAWNEVQKTNPDHDLGFAMICTDNADGTKDIMFIGHTDGKYIGRVVESNGTIKTFEYNE